MPNSYGRLGFHQSIIDEALNSDLEVWELVMAVPHGARLFRGTILGKQSAALELKRGTGGNRARSFQSWSFFQKAIISMAHHSAPGRASVPHYFGQCRRSAALIEPGLWLVFCDLIN
jgi:hypothetical protein